MVSVFVMTVIILGLHTSSDASESTMTSVFMEDEKKHSVSRDLLLDGDNSEQLFYIYELEEKYSWRWPNASSDCSRNKYVKADYAQLSGIGPAISPNDGLFLTWHFSLFSSLYNRLKRSSRRTLDPEKASLFIIPYDLALDGYTDPETCINRNPIRCSAGFTSELSTKLRNSKYFQRHKGADHALLWSLHENHYHPRRGGDVFMLKFCKLCTITCYWMDHTVPDNHFISIPFPSGYHYHDAIVNIPWDLANAPNRTNTAIYIGSTRTITKAHTDIRMAMSRQCNKKDGCNWLKIFHSSTDNRIGLLLSEYKKSVFCLCPPGDDPGRKAVFDSIVAGCIPVVFHVSTLFNQYPWHLGEQAALEISVFIPGDHIVSNQVQLMTILNGISPEIIKRKQAAIALLAPKLQYSVPPMKYLQNRSDETTWDPPFKDAADVTLDGMFARAANLIQGKPTGIPPFTLSKEEWEVRHNTTKI